MREKLDSGREKQSALIWKMGDFGPTLVKVLLSISPLSLLSPGFEIITMAVVAGFSDLDFGTKDWSTY